MSEVCEHRGRARVARALLVPRRSIRLLFEIVVGRRATLTTAAAWLPKAPVLPRERAPGHRWDPQEAVQDLGRGRGHATGEARRSWLSTRHQTSGARMSPSISKGDMACGC